jgi:hypothetical protein
MISTELARALQDSGLRWRPQRGDNFRIDRVEVDDEVFTLSDMTVEAHTFLWLPREDQLRDILGAAFRSLTRIDGGHRVEAVIDGSPGAFAADDAADAYGRALLALLDAVAG